MSTNYYYPAEPVKSLRVENGELHVELSDDSSFTLALDRAEETGFLHLLADDVDDPAAPMRTIWGGVGVGTVVREQVRGLDPDLLLISEYGELFTVAEIRARAGAGKGDTR